MDAEIARRIAALEARIVALEAKDKKNDADFVHYINQHGEHHHEIDDIAWQAYFKTHPEYRNSMDQYYKAVEAKSKGSDKPQG